MGADLARLGSRWLLLAELPYSLSADLLRLDRSRFLLRGLPKPVTSAIAHIDVHAGRISSFEYRLKIAGVPLQLRTSLERYTEVDGGTLPLLVRTVWLSPLGEIELHALELSQASLRLKERPMTPDPPVEAPQREISPLIPVAG